VVKSYKKRIPLYDWDQMLKEYTAASKLLEQHVWLVEWKRLSDYHTLSVEILDMETDPESPFNRTILHRWDLTGFNGKPRFRVYADFDIDGIVVIIFGPDDPRILIIRADNYVFTPDGLIQKDPEIDHWMHKLDVYFDPKSCDLDEKYNRYVIVQPSGEWELKTIDRCEPY
jgi:hypothetical protein